MDELLENIYILSEEIRAKLTELEDQIDEVLDEQEEKAQGSQEGVQLRDTSSNTSII